jgi:hypothetical protein
MRSSTISYESDEDGVDEIWAQEFPEALARLDRFECGREAIARGIAITECDSRAAVVSPDPKPENGTRVMFRNSVYRRPPEGGSDEEEAAHG